MIKTESGYFSKKNSRPSSISPVINNNVAAYIKSYSTADSIINKRKEIGITVDSGIHSSRIATINNARKENIQNIVKALSLVGVNVKNISTYIDRIVGDGKNVNVYNSSDILRKRDTLLYLSNKEEFTANNSHNTRYDENNNWLTKYISSNSDSNILFNK